MARPLVAIVGKMCIRDSIYTMILRIDKKFFVKSDVHEKIRMSIIGVIMVAVCMSLSFIAVSYTHLDVYKRQPHCTTNARAISCPATLPARAGTSQNPVL